MSTLRPKLVPTGNRKIEQIYTENLMKIRDEKDLIPVISEDIIVSIAEVTIQDGIISRIIKFLSRGIQIRSKNNRELLQHSLLGVTDQMRLLQERDLKNLTTQAQIFRNQYRI